MGMDETCLRQTPGNGAGAGQQGFVGHFSKGQPQGKGWSGHQRGTMHCLPQGTREFGVGDRVGRDDVDGAGERLIFQRKEDCGDDVVFADPTGPLPAAAQAAAQAQPKQGRQAGHHAAVWADHDAEAEMDDTDSSLLRGARRGFPECAEFREKALSRR
jgi:hypothetical protein